MPRPERLIGAAIAAVITLGLLVLLFGPARGLRNDIGAQRALIAAQLEVLQAQRDLVALQLEEARTTRELTQQNLTEVTRTRELTEEGLAEARRTRELAEQTLTTAQGIEGAVQGLEGDADTTAAQVRELVQVARRTLEQARQINRKTVAAGHPVP